MAARHRIDEFYLDVWNGDKRDNDGWTRKGPYTEDKIDEVFMAHARQMPNCPARMVGVVYLEHHAFNDSGETNNG